LIVLALECGNGQQSVPQICPGAAIDMAQIILTLGEMMIEQGNWGGVETLIWVEG
jgi:hypothetical protein